MIRPISGRPAFRQLRRSAERVRRGPLTVSRAPGSRPPSVVGVAYAIPRRVGSAVTRNLVRRRLRALARELAGGPEPILVPGHYLLSAAPGIEQLAFGDLRRCLWEALADFHPSAQTRGQSVHP